MAAPEAGRAREGRPAAPYGRHLATRCAEDSPVNGQRIAMLLNILRAIMNQVFKDKLDSWKKGSDVVTLH